MSPCRRRLFGLIASLFGSGLTACHEPNPARPNSEIHAPAPQQSAAQVNSASSSAQAPLLVPERARETTRSRSTESPAAPEPAQAAPSTNSAADRDAEPTPELFDEQGQALGQTDQRPTLSSASFKQRVAALAQAIISGDPEPALLAFFPLAAYQQVKAIAKPERDYRFRLVANFKRDLLAYHRELGASASETRFQEIVVPEQTAKWMAPGSEGNNLGYFRVLRSRLRFTLPTGRTRDFELTSMISWRGEWYIVHLHGFE